MMENKTLCFQKPILEGELKVPGDKSISHRAIMLGSIAEGITTVEGFLDGEDCLDTIRIFQKLGVTIERNGTNVHIDSPGINKWKTPTEQLDAGNAGTAARLLLGILASSNVTSTLVGDQYLSVRPMKRVTGPLKTMGARIEGKDDANYLPLRIVGRPLEAISYTMPIASAQIKSAILFAGLQANGVTTVSESTVSRDHTERMMMQFGAQIERDSLSVSIQGGQKLTGTDVVVPGDISSAAFFMAAAAMIEGSSVTFHNVGLNSTRTGIFDVLAAMGADLQFGEQFGENGEPYGTVTVRANALTGTEISGDIIPRLIDELPILALVATQANGQTVIKDAEELRVKETDRIAAVTAELKKLGATVEETPDGMIINGPTRLTGATLSSYGDHRIGMMGAIAALLADGEVTIEDTGCIAISYPTFFDHLQQLIASN